MVTTCCCFQRDIPFKICQLFNRPLYKVVASLSQEATEDFLQTSAQFLIIEINWIQLRIGTIYCDPVPVLKGHLPLQLEYYWL